MFTITATPQERLEAFHKRFEPLYGEGHRLFACHAVYPVIVSQDLLYQLWYNFRHYGEGLGLQAEMAPEVVSDFIHSGLCKPLSQGLYSVEDELRVLLLEELIKREGKERLRQLAHFLQAWLSQPQAHALRTSTRQLHEWVIGATLDPGKAARAVTEALSDNMAKGNRRENKRIYHVINSLKEHSPAFDELFQYAEKIAEQIQRQEGEDVILPAISFEEQAGIDLVKMPLTDDLRKKIGRRQEAQTDPEVLRRIEEAIAAGGRQVDLSNLSLTALPPELLELRELESLNLEGNSFAGIPIGLHHFPKLQNLNLASCQIFHLNLRLLDCPNLKWLSLDDNEITFIPGHIEQLKQLEYFSARYNPIKYVPGSMGSLPLQTIIIPDHRLETVPVGWQQLADFWEKTAREDETNQYMTPGSGSGIELDFGTNAFGNGDPSATAAQKLNYAISYSRGYFDGLNFLGNNRVVAVIAGTDRYRSSDIQDIPGAEAECELWAELLRNYLPEERLELRMAVGPEQCTKRGVIEALTRLSLSEGDQLVFIFTGYGARQFAPETFQPFYEEGMMSSLVCSDSRTVESDLYGIELEAIFAAASEQKAQITVITDASHAASLWRFPEGMRRNTGLYSTNAVDPKELFFVQGAEHPVFQQFAQASFNPESIPPPQPDLIHFAASQPKEQAMMVSQKDKNQIGIFNQSFFGCFERMPWAANVLNVGKRVSLQTKAFITSQQPFVHALGETVKNRSLFGEEQPGAWPELWVYYDSFQKAWLLNAGIIHGLPPEGAISLYLFDEFFRESDKPAYALAEVNVEQVDIEFSILDKALSHLDKQLIFRGVFKEIPLLPLTVHELDGRLAIWSEREMFQLREAWRPLFTENPEEAAIVIRERGAALYWRRADKEFPISAAYSKAGDPGNEISRHLTPSGSVSVCLVLSILVMKTGPFSMQRWSCIPPETPKPRPWHWSACRIMKLRKVKR
ncbi:MAG: leucine-rich repeat domain-containing protein [Bacteroidia bacterium]